MASWANTVKELVVGAVIGIASMLPGISGATMAVVFGIYERLIRDLANLRVWLRKDIKFIVILAVGVVVGTVLAAKALNSVMDSYEYLCMLFFAGLILGQVPAVYAEAGGKSEPLSAWGIIAFVVGLAIMVAVIAVDATVTGGDGISISRDAVGMLVMVVVGLIVAVSALLPGLSHSTVLMAMGLFGTFTAAVGDLDVFFLAPLAVGAIVGVLGFSKILRSALENHHRSMMLLVLGLTVGSFVSILFMVSVPEDTLAIVGSAVAFVVGILISVWSFRFGRIAEE